MSAVDAAMIRDSSRSPVIAGDRPLMAARIAIAMQGREESAGHGMARGMAGRHNGANADANLAPPRTAARTPPARRAATPSRPHSLRARRAMRRR
ncbi:hypothetical protein, partial [Burkholderia humptydooensis]|uniref:hypothetical protein n=1 Tax=Burkholderia humptydooensis TaxID=430531 RepID=UPI001E3F5C8E